MIYEFLDPVDKENLLDGKELHPAQIGNYIFISEGKPAALHDYDIALIGITDDRASAGNTGCGKAPDAIRREFYQLYLPPVEREFRLIDLGNIKTGESSRDTYFAVATVVLELLMHKVIPVIIGGSHDHTFGQYLGYKSLQKLVNVVNIDERLDMNEVPGAPVNAANFLMRIFTHSPNYLFNFAHLGYQTYLNDSKAVDTLESLSFECHRLGLVRASIEDTEPVLRDADMLSIDIAAIRQADAPAHAHASPNGFTGEELCQITRYAGLSDKLTSLGIYETNPSYDNNRQTTQLVAQMIWYFVEGYYSRVGDFPVTVEDYLRFTVRLEDSDHNLVFYKSKKTERWWMEIPATDTKRFGDTQLVPCSFKDYETAGSGDLPERWMRAYTKLA